MIGLAGLVLATAAPAHGAPTRGEYIAATDPICRGELRAMIKSVRGIGADARRERWRRAAAKYRRATRAFRRMIRRLAVVEPPAADARLIGRWLQGLRAQRPMLRRLIRAVARGQVNRIFKRAVILAIKSDETQELVRGYGFRFCQRV